jgi:pheromone shutdown protein TraB
LTERYNGKDVYLVGTLNNSTMLAQRTKKLIEEIQPDTVIVQTSEDWWNSAKLLQYVDSQEEMNKYRTRLNAYLNKPSIDMYFNNRKWIFLARLALYKNLFDWHFRLGFDFNFWQPGLEAKFACEAAEKVGAKIMFAGGEMDP